MQSGATVQEGKGKVRSGSELLDVFEVSFLVISILLVMWVVAVGMCDAKKIAFLFSNKGENCVIWERTFRKMTINFLYKIVSVSKEKIEPGNKQKACPKATKPDREI